MSGESVRAIPHPCIYRPKHPGNAQFETRTQTAGLARAQLRALEQPLAEHPGAAIGIGADECRKLLRSALSIVGYVAVLLPRRLRWRSVLVVALSRLEWLVCKPHDWPVRRPLEWLVREPLD